MLSLAGLAIAIGEMVDATIVIVEGCTAELAARGPLSPDERREIIVRSIASVTRPLLFSLLITLASFVPVFFLGAREARLFDPLAFTKTSAMAFSTLLTLVLLPILIVWIFRRWQPSQRTEVESVGVCLYRGALRLAIEHRYLVVGLHIAIRALAGTERKASSMAAMPSMGMPEMCDVFTLAHRGSGTYAGTARLSMGGTWLVTISVSRRRELLGRQQLTIFAAE